MRSDSVTVREGNVPYTTSALQLERSGAASRDWLPLLWSPGRAASHPRPVHDGRVAANAKGTRFGRKPKLTDYQRDEVLKRREPAESCRSIGKTMGVHHATSAGLGA